MEIKKLLQNKKFSLSLIITGIGIIILVAVLALFSIISNRKEGESKSYSDTQRNLIYDIGCKAVSGSSFESLLSGKTENNLEYPFSENLKRILSHYFIKEKTTVTLLELYYPQYCGLAEGLGFYVPSDDNAMWVEETLVRAEEERIAKELHEMEESLDEYNEVEEEWTEDAIADESESDDYDEAESELNEDADSSGKRERTEEYHSEKADNIEKSLESQKDPLYYTNKNSQLSILYNDGEILIPSKTDDGHSIIMANDQQIIRRFFNEQMRLVKKENWSVKNISLKKPDSVEEMKYSEDGKTLLSKLIEAGEDYTLIYYNEDGLTKNVEHYVIFENKKYTLSKRSCLYNENGKITSDETTDYVYTGKDYKKLKYTFTKKYIYEYNEGDIPPDFRYYENNVMKMHNKYAAEKGSYTSHIFFDEKLSVKSYYEEDKHIKDVYYNGNKIMREKVYEQQ